MRTHECGECFLRSVAVVKVAAKEIKIFFGDDGEVLLPGQV